MDRDADWNQRRTPSRSVLAGVEPLAAKRVSNEVMTVAIRGVRIPPCTRASFQRGADINERMCDIIVRRRVATLRLVGDVGAVDQRLAAVTKIST